MAGLVPYQQEVCDLFVSEWSRKAQGSQPDIHRTAQIIAFSTSRAKDPAPSTYIWSSILAIHQFATSNPEAIDFVVRAFTEAIKLFPDSVSNEYGNGPSAGFKELRWWLIDEANCFNSVEPSNPAGTLDPNDKSNIIFREEEVDDRLDAVLGQIQEWRVERTKRVISWLLQHGVLLWMSSGRVEAITLPA